MKKNKKKKMLIVVIIIILLLIIGGCFLIFNNKSKDYTSELPNPEENPILENIKSQMTLDDSMDGFANYISQLYGMIYSIDSTVAENPEDFTDIIASQIETIDAYMSIYNNYDSYVNSLDENTYSALKSNWKNFAKQSKDLYNKIKGEKYTKGKNFITDDSYEKQFNALSNEISKFVSSSTDESTNTETSTQDNTTETTEETTTSEDSNTNE